MGARELKFRAWDETRKRMFVSPKWVEFRVVGGTLKAFNYHPSGAERELIVMQYTGLKDKNGIDIYEGDIVKANLYPFYGDASSVQNGKTNPVELNYIGEVGIDEDGAYYELKAVSSRVRGDACGSNLSEIADQAELIGNIHENPELLKESE